MSLSQFILSVMSNSATPSTAACRASLSITDSWSFVKLVSIQSVIPSNHLILYHSLLLPSMFPSTRIFSNESFVHIRWAKYCSFSFRISPSNEYSGLIFFRKSEYLGLTGLISLQSKRFSRVFLNTTVLKLQFFSGQLSSQFNSHIHM